MEMSDDLDGFERRFIRQVGARKSLVEYSDGDCIFLDPQSRNCIVYASRPIQCRTWPFWNRNLDSRHAWDQAAEGCPGCNRGQVIPLEAIELARSQKAV
jgi:Fe-S-cluster containining protein